MNGLVPVVTVTRPPLDLLQPGIGTWRLHTTTKPGDSYESSQVSRSPPLTSNDTPSWESTHPIPWDPIPSYEQQRASCRFSGPRAPSAPSQEVGCPPAPTCAPGNDCTTHELAQPLHTCLRAWLSGITLPSLLICSPLGIVVFLIIQSGGSFCTWSGSRLLMPLLDGHVGLILPWLLNIYHYLPPEPKP